MNKKLAQVLLITTSMGTLGMNLQAVAADTTEQKATASVDMTAGSGPTDPIPDPNHPGTGDKGALALDYVSSFGFGEIKLGNTTVEVTPVNDGTALTPLYGVQVSDLRGTGAGWKLTATLSEFTGATDDSHKLNGASLTLPAGTLTTNNVDKTNEPTAQEVILQAGGTSGQELLKADAEKGLGTWFDQMDGNNIKLSIPSGQYSDNYAATITYSLTDAP